MRIVRRVKERFAGAAHPVVNHFTEPTHCRRKCFGKEKPVSTYPYHGEYSTVAPLGEIHPSSIIGPPSPIRLKRDLPPKERSGTGPAY
jgi:hypothetical protein